MYSGDYAWWWLLAATLAYTVLLALGSMNIRWNFYFRSVNRLPILKVSFESGQMSVNQRGKQLALTFDDGPAPTTPAVLDILKQEGVQATFFLIGKNIAGNENMVQRMQAEGHNIGNHSFNHGFNFDWQSAGRMLAEIEQTSEAITSVTGQPVSLFRPPYGVTNPNLAKAVRNSGLRSIGWSLRSRDTVAGDGQALRNKILAKVKSGDIILLHDRCQVTVDMLPSLLQELKNRGYSFATV